MRFHDKSCDCGRCARERRNRGTQSLAVKIALSGGAVSKGVFVSKWVPYCDEPVEINRMITSREAVDELKAMEVSLKVPCRRCKKCLQFRQMKWRESAITEISVANRTWWMCLTFEPIHLAGILLEAESDEMKKIEGAAYKHVQRYFKRLRKHKNVFRYLAVFELGKQTGRQHYHLLLHENGDKPILKKCLEDQWRSNVWARLVRCDEAGGRASYITKYTTKHFDIRPRASFGYGKLNGSS